MLERKLSITLLMLAMLMFLAVFAATPVTAQGTEALVWTDKEDYSPEETVTIYGSGFNPEATVNITVTRPDGNTNEWAVTSDSSGSFTTTYLLDGITGTYTVTATDGTNTATTTFTDAVVLINIGLSPTSVVAGSTVSFTLTVSVPPNVPGSPPTIYASIGSISISMGAGWGTPTFVVISGSGISSWTTDTASDGLLKIKTTSGSPAASLNPGESMTVTFDVTAPSSTGSSTWSITGYNNNQFNPQSNTQTQDVDVVALTVEKTADTSITRTYTWTIDKSADCSTLTLSLGEQFGVQYTVTVGATYADSYGVSGTITIHNPSDAPAVISSVDDVVSPSITATVTPPLGGFPYTLAADGDLVLDYSASLPNADSRTNTATAHVGAASFSSDPVDVDFSGATMIEVDKSIDVSDTYAGLLGTVTYGVDTLPKTFTYSRTIGPYNVIGDYTVENTATFVASDTDATDSDSWTVNVHVQGAAFCAITSSGFVEIDVFKLIFTPDVPTNPGYFRLTASNPGQFYYNIYYMATSGDEEFTIEIPYPFVTQGANPVHIYDHAPSGYTPTGTDITSQFTINGVPVTIDSYGASTFGSDAEITITNNGYTGPLYITIHLDYGLKKIAGGYSNDGTNDATATAGKSSCSTIEDGVDYEFAVSDAFSDNDSISNMNVFKHDPGIGGLVLDVNGNPLKGIKVQIYDPTGKLLATVYTDEDGWYMYNYKHTGKAATYTIELPDYSLQQSVTLKANSFVVVNFQIP